MSCSDEGESFNDDKGKSGEESEDDEGDEQAKNCMAINKNALLIKREEGKSMNLRGRFRLTQEENMKEAIYFNQSQ